MTETQRQLIYELAKRLDMVIEVGGLRWKFIDGKLQKL